ncbi:type IV toxin-antitoxin system AbiEi family antitoxin domain-containing protein [Sphingobacterium haloxyli]|uniref:Transcriptional regulator, AbiEi antitoxin, Type IV TA system n=1 Tax=Sphingobacterium haloxyli TaxID=2100533 RepID=A0A2S9J260_9SPHI|nr:hypothetical protein [Sphingobacterium haloxyli]PRD46824.1 hypothetical protein C5745_13235 [Sphingobacterium haloxyli]
MDLREDIEKYAAAPLSRHVMLELLKDYKRPNDKISELAKAGMLTILKNGLYIPMGKRGFYVTEPFLVANHLWGPSYVSLESALSHWGFIPERVYEIASMTTKTSKKYETAIGRFTYRHLVKPYYSLGIKQVTLKEKQVALIASPEKAICDKIITTHGLLLRSAKQVTEFLIEDMRIDEDNLRKLNVAEMRNWLQYAPKRTSLETLVKTLALL